MDADVALGLWAKIEVEVSEYFCRKGALALGAFLEAYVFDFLEYGFEIEFST